MTPFFIVGPTAVGKTAIAVEVAERCGAEIVSADAFQVYAGLDRLTAQPSADEVRRVSHHLVGCVPLSETYSVARYLADASRCLQEIAARGRRAIVVGGSGLYVKALTHGLSPLPPAQLALRADLEKTELPDLVARLRTLDPAATETIDLKNKRRLVRAIEVCVATGRPYSDQKVTWQKRDHPVLPLGVFLTRNRSELNERIDRRVHTLFGEQGIEEVRRTMDSTLSETSSRIIGLRAMGAYLRHEIDQPTCREEIAAATRRYAKRQMTWFRGEAVFETFGLPAIRDSEPHAKLIADKLMAWSSQSARL